MANSYMPRRDDDLAIWLQSFAGGISSNPSLYMLTPGQAAPIQSVVDDFVTAHRVANNSATRTRVTIIAKDNARSIAVHLCQQYYSLIKVNAGIDDADKIAIGVRPINPARRRISCPQTSPLLNILGCTPGEHTLRYRDTTTPGSSGKPFGAIALQLFVAIGDGPGAAKNREEAKLVGSFTRNPIAVAFEQSDDRKKATYWARWVSRRGEVGPWSLPASMSIAA